MNDSENLKKILCDARPQNTFLFEHFEFVICHIKKKIKLTLNNFATAIV